MFIAFSLNPQYEKLCKADISLNMEWKEEDKNMTGVFHHNKINENTTATPPNLSEMEPSKSNSSVVSKPTQTK